MRHGRKFRRPRRDKGTILIVTMWIVLVLVGLVLVLARSMKTEVVCSANDFSSLQADAVEQGAIQYVLTHVDSANRQAYGEAVGEMPQDINMPCELVRVGAGAFWIIRPNFDDSTQYAFGLTDEASKVNLNTAGLPMLSLLPDMTSELAPCIIDWRSTGSTPSSGGAKSEYYLTLSDPYNCKSAPFETVEELFLVKGATRQIIYGEDLNRNGVLDPGEDTSGDGILDYGILPFVTVYSAEPNTDADGKARVNVNNRQALASLLTKTFSSARSGEVMGRLARVPTLRSVLDFYVRSGLTATEFQSVADHLTAGAGNVQRGLINVATAPKQVLACLPGLTDSDIASLMSKRTDTTIDPTNLAWVVQALTGPKAQAIGSLITTRAFQFSADIVSVSADGRAFRRCVIVVDARTSPPKVVYRQDLTRLGWPLDPNIITQLRAGVTLDSFARAQTAVQEAIR
ncbi:MAG: hypothetical protein ACE15C_18825 [Phycisphaerae bacterium]